MWAGFAFSLLKCFLSFNLSRLRESRNSRGRVITDALVALPSASLPADLPLTCTRPTSAVKRFHAHWLSRSLSPPFLSRFTTGCLRSKSLHTQRLSPSLSFGPFIWAQTCQ